MLYEIQLRGFNGGTDQTDHLILWVDTDLCDLDAYLVKLGLYVPGGVIDMVLPVPDLSAAIETDFVLPQDEDKFVAHVACLVPEFDGSPLSALQGAIASATPEWFPRGVKDPENFDGKNIEIHDAYGRTATVYGEIDDAETLANASLMVLSRKHMADLLVASSAMGFVSKAYSMLDQGKISQEVFFEKVQQAVLGNLVVTALDRLTTPSASPVDKCLLNDRYAETIIGNRSDDYDALEIQGVRDIHLPNDPEGTCCEVDNENPQFFSVYAHLKEGGVECVGDFATHVLAETYAKELAAKYNWPIYDYVSKLNANEKS